MHHCCVLKIQVSSYHWSILVVKVKGSSFGRHHWLLVTLSSYFFCVFLFLTNALNVGVCHNCKSSSAITQSCWGWAECSLSEISEAVPWCKLVASPGRTGEAECWGRSRNWLSTAAAGPRNVTTVEVL